MTPVEYFTSAAAIVTLLWSVVNEIRLRAHAKALQENEAHLRVTSELRLRLHQESWTLLRETQVASFAAFNALRTYQLGAISAARGGKPVWHSSEYNAAQIAVQNYSGLAHVTPPERRELREAASEFTTVLSMINDSVAGGPAPEQQLDEVIRQTAKALTAASLGTKQWNEELWQNQTVTALAKRE